MQLRPDLDDMLAVVVQVDSEASAVKVHLVVADVFVLEGTAHAMGAQHGQPKKCACTVLNSQLSALRLLQKAHHVGDLCFSAHQLDHEVRKGVQILADR